MCVYFFLLQYFLSTSMLALTCVCALDCMYTSECVCVCAPSLPGTAPGVLVVGTHCDNLLLSYAGDQHWWRGRVNSSSVAKLWSFNAPARIPATTPPPHRDTNTEWHNLMKFCSLKQVVVCRDGGMEGRYEKPSGPSAHLFLWIVSTNQSMRRFSPGLSVLSPVIEGCKFMSETGLTLFLSGPATWKRRSSAINGVKASFLRRPTEREMERETFSIKVFSLRPDTMRMWKDTW